MKLIAGVVILSLYGLAQSSLVDLCTELVEHNLQGPQRLEEWCDIQMAIVHLQSTADSLAEEEFEVTDTQGGVKDKRKNEFIRFGKRKNEFIRFGKRSDAAGPEEFGNEIQKRKNEFIRFGKRKNEFIRFGKRKNEFIRFGKRKNEFIRFGKKDDPQVDDLHAAEKRKNEFIRFG